MVMFMILYEVAVRQLACSLNLVSFHYLIPHIINLGVAIELM